MKLLYLVVTAIALAQTLETIAQDAFIYGVPLIGTFQFRAGILMESLGAAYNEFFLNPVKPEGYFQAIFTKQYQKLPGTNLLPNADVVYAAGNINLATPKMMSVPAYANLDRFSSVEIFDLYTNVYFSLITQVPYVSSNLTNPYGAGVVLYGPNTSLSDAQSKFTGVNHFIQCNTVDVLAIIRIQVFNSSAAEMDRARAVKEKYKILPQTAPKEGLQAVSKIKADLASQNLTMEDITGLLPTQCNQTDYIAQKCWQLIGLGMKTWPILTQEAVAYTTPFSLVGLSQSSGFTYPSNQSAQAAIRASNLPDLLGNPIVEKLVTTFPTKWQVKTAFSRIYNITSDDLFLRATVGSLLPNPPEEAIYFILQYDSNGDSLLGGSTYSMKFPKGQLPPVNSFWSITVYDKSTGAFVNHTFDHSISSSKSYSPEEDGSVEIIFSNKNPSRKSNWLQITKVGNPFVLVLIAYFPKASVLDLSYVPPAVLKH